MKIIVAVNNEKIKGLVDEEYKDKVYEHDIVDMESLIGLLTKLNSDSNFNANPEGAKNNIIVITKDDLEGNLTNKTYIKHIRLANSNVKIILITKKLDNEYKEFLFANEVFNIIEGEKISKEMIKEQIEKDKFIVHSYIDTDTNRNGSFSENINQIITRQIFAIFGTSGSGKSYFSNLFSSNISRKLKIKTLLLDFDILNPFTDILNEIDVPGGALNQVLDDIDKNLSIKEIEKYMYSDKKEKNLWYLTNNTTLFDCQNRLSEKYYNNLLEQAKKSFDYLVVDLPSSPFLDIVKYSIQVASYIVFVINPNYSSIRQAIKYLKLINKMWGIQKSRILIVANKRMKASLDANQIENLLDGYTVIADIDFNSKIEDYINGFQTVKYDDLDLSKLYSQIGIKKNEGKPFSIKRKMFINIGKKDAEYDNKLI